MSILVTGGTGSMGQMLVKRLRSLGHDVVVFSRDEAKQYEMQTSGEFEGVKFRLGDIRRYDDIRAALEGVSVVINAAALKQVPACEYSPEQAVLTNCLGMQNLINAVKTRGSQVEAVVTVSTDKACKPTNVMGMTKAIQERMMVAANLDSDVRFVGVRYGNVMNSRGSVIPLFKKQIARGVPVTITAPEMTRFLISLEQAVELVVAAWLGARPGEIYVPEAPSATVWNIARALGVGSEFLDEAYPYKILGPRPGEKIHEIMIGSEEQTIRRGKYHVVTPMLQELRGGYGPTEHTTELSSEDHTVGLHEVRAILEKAELV